MAKASTPRKTHRSNESRILKNLTHLLEEVSKLDQAKTWLFRGVGDYPHQQLIPKIGRVRSDTALARDGAVSEELEKRALYRFRDQVRSRIQLNLENELEWMVLGQHYGLATRLLDWTLSPLVAAHFCLSAFAHIVTVNEQMAFHVYERIRAKNPSLAPTSRVNFQGIQCRFRFPYDGAIYAIPQPKEITPAQARNPFKVKSVRSVVPPQVTDRIQPQMSIFTLMGTPHLPWDPPDAKIFIIPSDLKLQFQFDLNKLGINGASLLPGVQETAAHISWQLKWGLPI